MNESNIYGVSVRSIIAFIIVICCCLLAYKMKDMPVLKELALIATGYLFGKTPTNGGSNNEKVSDSDNNAVNADVSNGSNGKPNNPTTS